MRRELYSSELCSSLKGPSAVTPSEVSDVFQGLLCRSPPSSPISTNSLAPILWKNPRQHGKDAFSRGPSDHGPGTDPTSSTGSRQPFDLGRPAFGGNRRRRKRPGGREHHFGGVRG
jgi:hypothetical protein